MSAETTAVYVTPHGGEPGAPLALHPAEMQIRELSDGVLEVQDPLFENPYRIGDRSLISDPTADDYARLFWATGGLHASVRHLTNTEVYETKSGTGRWGSLQHSISYMALAATYGAKPIEIMRAATHDKGKRMSAHKADDLLDGRGKENAHDNDLLSFSVRSGFVNELEAAGLVSEGTFTGLDGVPVNDAFDLTTQPQGFMNWPGKTGNMEAERVQYILHEGAIWQFSPETAREILGHIGRMPDSEQGDQLIFDDIEAAMATEIAQIRCYTEHWSDPVNDIIDELLMTSDRAMLTSRHPHLLDYNRFYPGDTLYTLEEDWQALRHELMASDGFMAAIHKILTPLVALQRDAHATFDGRAHRYPGPVLPDWLTLQESMVVPSGHQRMMGGKQRGMKGNSIVIEMQPGKVRTVNPWVKLPGKVLERVEDRVPALADFRKDQSKWSGFAYDAVIDLDHPALQFTAAEKRAVSHGLKTIDAEWPAALERPLMPDDMLEKRVRAANERYRQIGKFPLETLLARAS